MASPQVFSSEIDLTTRVPSFPGVYGYISGAFLKGEVGVPTLVTSETQYLARYTANDQVEVGEDMAHFSALAFLQKSNKLWVIRVAKDALHGGVIIGDTKGDASNLSSGVANPKQHVFGPNDTFLLYGKDPGAWNNNIKVAVLPYEQEPNAFQISVFYNNVKIEDWVCSRTEGQKDGYNRSMYIEHVLQQSNYIRALDNPLNTNPVKTGVITDTKPFTLGSNGTAVTDSERVKAVDVITNTSAYQCTILLDGGNATVSYQKSLIACAEKRKDCVAILSIPYEAQANSDYLNKIIEYRTDTLNANSSYAAIYTPHLKVYDKFNDRKVWVSPDGYVGAVISSTADNYELWYPPAGFRRGMLATIEDVYRRFTLGEMDLLYDKQINVIRFAPGKGILVWGQKTLLSRPSRLDRLNVRLLLIYIEPAIAAALEDYIFEINNVANRQLVTAMIGSYLENIKGRNGVYDYYVQCNDENNTAEDIDNNRMNVYVFVKPTASAEFIRFKTVITPTGLDFGTASSSI